MIFSENRYPLFGIMLKKTAMMPNAAARGRLSHWRKFGKLGRTALLSQWARPPLPPLSFGALRGAGGCVGHRCAGALMAATRLKRKAAATRQPIRAANGAAGRSLR